MQIDPACGSGAFLNCAFDYLKKEGQHAVEARQKLADGQLSFVDWGAHILQNNLFGVDLNAESVEITKLSLWLKTASKSRPLASLEGNIKCGNSIISDPAIAPSPFDWNAEFAEIMQGGFDIVVGNPPYGAALGQAEKDHLTKTYATTEYNFDTYKTFMELGLNLTKRGGYMGYITPNTFFVLEKGASRLRKFLFEEHTLLDVVELFNVFPGAVASNEMKTRRYVMKCIVTLMWDDGTWISSVSTDDGESIGCTLESGSFDALVERVKTVVLEMLDENFGYVGEVELDYAIERKDNLRPISWQPRQQTEA